jgi:hypothetical protein
VTAPVRTASELRRAAEVEVRPNGDVEGSLRMQLTGHWAEVWLDRVRDPSRREDVLLDINRLSKDGAKLSEIVTSVAGADSDSVLVQARFQWPAFTTVTGKRVLLQPALWAARAPALFASASRQTPIAFQFGWAESDSIVFHLPPGYRLESSDPTPSFEATGLLRHELDVDATHADRGVVTLVRHLTCASEGRTTFPRSIYSDVRQAFQTVAERDQMTLSFAKAD